MSNSRKNVILVVLFTITMPLAVVLSTHLARSSFEKVKLRDQVITVKGYAERPIVSDRATWSTGIVERQPDLKAAYARLETDRGDLLKFLETHGFPAEQVDPAPVAIGVVYAKDKEGHLTNTIEGYTVSQSFSIANPDVQKIAKVAREVGGLIAGGVELNSSAPQYLFTKLDAAKLEMIGEATANARQRAEQLVSGSRNHLGPLRGASQGVFQITPAYSTEVSGSGENDTGSINKVIKAVVTLEFAIE
jgi:hypothetical protein